MEQRPSLVAGFFCMTKVLKRHSGSRRESRSSSQQYIALGLEGLPAIQQKSGAAPSIATQHAVALALPPRDLLASIVRAVGDVQPMRKR